MDDVKSLAQGKYNRGKSPRIISTYKMELQVSCSICAQIQTKSVL